MFLITLPEHEQRTEYISDWSKPIINFAKQRNVDVIIVAKKNVNRTNLEKYLKKRKNIKLIMFNGHGNYDRICGHKDEPLIISGENEKLLKSKIVFCRSCKCGKKLAPDSVISGAIAFAGYKEEFVCLADPSISANPLDDVIAKKFLEPSNIFVISLLKGNTVDESYERSKSYYKKEIENLLTSETSPEDRDLLPLLRWDYQHFIYHGDGSATYFK